MGFGQFAATSQFFLYGKSHCTATGYEKHKKVCAGSAEQAGRQRTGDEGGCAARLGPSSSLCSASLSCHATRARLPRAIARVRAGAPAPRIRAPAHQVRAHETPTTRVRDMLPCSSTPALDQR